MREAVEVRNRAQHQLHPTKRGLRVDALSHHERDLAALPRHSAGARDRTTEDGGEGGCQVQLQAFAVGPEGGGADPDAAEHQWCAGDLHERESQVQGRRKRHYMEVSWFKTAVVSERSHFCA